MFEAVGLAQLMKYLLRMHEALIPLPHTVVPALIPGDQKFKVIHHS